MKSYPVMIKNIYQKQRHPEMGEGRECSMIWKEKRQHCGRNAENTDVHHLGCRTVFQNIESDTC